MMAPQPQPLPLPLAHPPAVAAGFGDTTLTKVFVGGLAWETHKDTLREHFERYGDILEAVIISDKLTGRSKGYGFVSAPLSPHLSSSLPGLIHALTRGHMYMDGTGDVQGGGRRQEGVRGRHPRHQRPPRQLQPGLPGRQAAAPAAAPAPPLAAGHPGAAARAHAPVPAPARARWYVQRNYCCYCKLITAVNVGGRTDKRSHVFGANSPAAIAVGSRGVSPVPWYYHPSTTPPAAAHYAHQQYHGVLPFYPAATTYGYVRAPPLLLPTTRVLGL